MIEPGRYRPIHVTEVDERTWDDCGPCSFLMLAQAWTVGEVVHRLDGREMSKPELKRLRESWREGGQVTGVEPHGGTSALDAGRYLRATWPFLPGLPAPTRDWSAIKAALGDSFIGALNGNPKDCPPDSPLRRWLSGDDDYGHWIYADRLVEGRGIYVMDPLGGFRDGYYTEYDGEWVPAEHVRLYLANRAFNAILVRRGAQTAEARTRRAERERFREAKAAWEAEKAALEARIVPITDAVAAERERIATAVLAVIRN